MIIHDSLYGSFEVEPVLHKLIQTSPVQRLKQIHQGGASYLVNPNWNVTRFDHSIGVMLLVKKLGGSIEEQIASLLHDVSHTAFSHVIDYVLTDGKENFHEQIFEETLLQSEIPQVLIEFGFTLDSILQMENWTLLEQPLPLLCADRIDYTLRDLSTYKMISIEDSQNFIDSLQVCEGKICISSIEKAEWFVKTYYAEVIDFFLHPLNVYAYHKLTKVLRIALTKKELTKRDFLLTDHHVWLKLTHSTDPEIQELLQGIHTNVQVIHSPTEYDFHMVKKLRLLDPLICSKQMIMGKGSEISLKIKNFNEEALNRSLEGTFVKII
ncbi:HD domain-containing protein [Bacillus cereus]|uniref:HD domain-containing protein n=1 Tax=Bacillus cereus TaxID=1396 RepID=UPI00356E1F17